MQYVLTWYLMLKVRYYDSVDMLGNVGKENEKQTLNTLYKKQ